MVVHKNEKKRLKVAIYIIRLISYSVKKMLLNFEFKYYLIHKQHETERGQ